MKRENKRRSHWFGFLYTKLFLIVGGIAAVWIGVAVVRGFSQRYAVSTEIETLKAEISRLERDQNDLTALLHYLDSEEFIKQEGKIKFGLKEEGERVVVINETRTESKPDLQLALATSEEEISNPRKWWKFFFN